MARVVRIQAIYATDEMYYGALLDDACNPPRSINVVDPFYTRGDESVTSFFKLAKDRCEKLGQLVCPTKTRLDVEALIRKDQNGHLIAELKHIYSAQSQ
ncbi:hypothetical protein SAMN05216570_0126 [Dyella sp. OK004]|uniref:hypothetical protein n=1 Tax=Dyella sp. OK004 TaxID=1855292 RepID=UPI0008E398B2|nr:hypothetical protein [Dyella sp. OK004]SFR86667.1 hypothetical protein SAMN05216570_0126 [Dyella sp. OK004]